VPAEGGAKVACASKCSAISAAFSSAEARDSIADASR